MARNFNELTEREILALAIALKEEDQRVYADFADGLRESYPATAFQVVVGGVLVFLAGILIGSS